jgi:hypothetical protein
MSSTKQLPKASVLITCLAIATDAFASNILVNGNFENGATGFSTGYVHGDDSARSLVPEGAYEIGSDPNQYHSDFAAVTAQDGNAMMIVNGATWGNAVVWSQSDLAVQANTTYYFSAWVASVIAGAPATLGLRINGQDLGTFQATGDTSWQQFSTTWYSGSDTTAVLALVDKNTIAVGNDFALDNLYFDALTPGASAIPEPPGLALLGLGLAGALLARRRNPQ